MDDSVKPDEWKPILTPMDKKTIVNAITKRIPEVRKVDLVEINKALYQYQLVVVCQLVHEVAILVEDDFNMMMRHNELMNIVDNLSEELKKRKLLQKTNKLPENFFHDDGPTNLQKFQS